MSKQEPKISVITVCLNAAEVVKRTIESVLIQSYSNLEYIVIDGGSKDGTKEIIESFGPRINHFVSERDNGIYDAMNKGIKTASGELIAFLNAGDYYISSNVLSYVVNKMRLSEASVFYGRFIWEDIARKEIVLSNHSSVQYDWDLKHSNFPHPATFYKRHLFDNIGLFDTTYKILGDYEWNVRALVSHRIKFQYIDIIVALFATNGMSNDEKNTNQVNEETQRISSQYFQPSWLFNFQLHRTYSNFLKKVVAKVFSKRLNRSW